MNLGIITSSDHQHLPPGEGAALQELNGQVRHQMVVWDQTPVAELEHFDVVLVRTCWDYHLKYNAFTQWLNDVKEAKINLVNPAETILWNSNKRYMLDMQHKALPVVPTFERHQVASLLEQFPNTNKMVVKRLISASAHELQLVERSDLSASGSAIADNVIIQPYLSDIERNGEWSVVYFNNRMSHAFHKVPKKGEHRVQKEFGGSYFIEEPPKEILRLAHQAIAEITYPFRYARVDLIETHTGCLVMELELIEPELFLDNEEAKENYQQFILHLAN